MQNDFPGNPGPPTLTPQQVQITEGDVLAQLGLTTARLEIALRAIGERDRIISQLQQQIAAAPEPTTEAPVPTE